jgi:hypothetical protein
MLMVPTLLLCSFVGILLSVFIFDASLVDAVVDTIIVDTAAVDAALARVVPIGVTLLDTAPLGAHVERAVKAQTKKNATAAAQPLMPSVPSMMLFSMCRRC